MRSISGDLITDFQYLKIDYKQEGNQCFEWVNSDRKSGKGFKLREGEFRLDVMGKFFTGKVMKHGNWLPKEAVAAPSLEEFKAWLNGTMGKLI